DSQGDMCISVPRYGAELVLAPCAIDSVWATAQSQLWTFTWDGSANACGLYSSPSCHWINNVSTGLNMDIEGNSSNDGANVDVWTYTGGFNQHFSVDEFAWLPAQPF